MKQIIFLMALLILISGAYGLNESVENTMNETNLCEFILEKVNVDAGTEIPSAIPYKNEVINIYSENKEEVGHLIIEDGIIKEYDCQLLNESTINAHIKNKQTIEDIMDSENQINELVNKIKADEIRIEGLTAGKKIKNFFMMAALRVINLFS